MNDQICFGAPWDFGNGQTACASKNIFFTFQKEKCILNEFLINKPLKR